MKLSLFMMRHYLDDVLSLGILDGLLSGEDELPPDDVAEYAVKIPALRNRLAKFDDTDFFRIGLENLLLSTDDDALEAFNPSQYPFDGEELREIFAFCYAQLFPDAQLPDSQPAVEWVDWSFGAWLEQRGIRPKTLTEVAQPIENLQLSKAAFAVLLERVVGDPFILDVAAQTDLGLSEETLREARIELASRHLIGVESGVHPKLAECVQAIVATGWKGVAQVQAQSADWSQIGLHFGDGLIAGEAFNEQEERLLTQLESVEEAISWLLDLLPIGESSGTRGARKLDKLLPKAQLVVTFLVVNSADDDAAKAAVVFLQTDKGLWFIDRDAMEERANNLTKTALQERLVRLVNGYLSHAERRAVG